MAWKVSDPMSERVKLIGLMTSGERTVSGLCREFGISRKTAYKWAARFEEHGLRGLEEHSRAPLHPANAMPGKVRDLVLDARMDHRSWGPKKLKAWLEGRYPEQEIPAASTIGDLLKREGLVKERRRHLRPGVPPRRPIEVTAPNDEWNVDFKGEFRMGNGEYCYPLTVTDAYSRYVLEVRALRGTGTEGARESFERIFRDFGLPESIRSDNGVPFAARGLARLSSLAVWWLRLGIRRITTRPGHPQDNPRHERMHRTLKAETTRPPAWAWIGQQRKFDRFRGEFNEERPHEALGQRPPARVYRASRRPYPERLPEPEYPGYYEVRSVGSGGVFHWRDRMVFITKSLERERIGLVEIEDGIWRVYFGALEIGILNERNLVRRRTGRVLPMSPV